MVCYFTCIIKVIFLLFILLFKYVNLEKKSKNKPQKCLQHPNIVHGRLNNLRKLCLNLPLNLNRPTCVLAYIYICTLRTKAGIKK